MVSLNGIYYTLKTTKNVFDVILLHYSKKPKQIAFKCGVSDTFTWSEYVLFRRLILDGYIINNCPSDLNVSNITETDSLYFVHKGKFKLLCNKRTITALTEPLEKHYKLFDYNGKVVLDIGGFGGETTILFWTWGARKIITFEPVAENVELINANCRLNQIPAFVFNEGIGIMDATQPVRCESLDMSFGLNDVGSRVFNIKLRSIEKIIEFYKPDIAKFDCEGCEKCLLSLPDECLKAIPNYIIEAHSNETERLLKEKFFAAGFSMINETQIDKTIHMMAFKLQ